MTELTNRKRLKRNDAFDHTDQESGQPKSTLITINDPMKKTAGANDFYGSLAD